MCVYVCVCERVRACVYVCFNFGYVVHLLQADMVEAETCSDGSS